MYALRKIDPVPKLIVPEEKYHEIDFDGCTIAYTYVIVLLLLLVFFSPFRSSFLFFFL